MPSTTVSVALSRPTPPWRHVARQVLAANLLRAGWFWAGSVVICSVALFTISRFTEMSLSGMHFVHQAALWFQFAMAISVVAVYLPVHVAAGTTRRAFVRGAVIAAEATSVGYSIILATLLLIEGQI